MNAAIAALSALAQPSRLSAFRLLVRAGADGLPAGAIARELGVPHNTLSTHLGVLTRGALVRAERQGRRIVYRADFDGARALLAYLMEDCCMAAPGRSARALEGVLPRSCDSITTENHDETPAR